MHPDVTKLCSTKIHHFHTSTMAKNYAFLVAILVIILDILAGILAIKAESAQNEKKHFRNLVVGCRESSSKAFNLGLAASVLLLLAHATANALGGCIFFRSKEDYTKASANKILAVASLVLSWVFLAVGFSLLVIGTIENSKSRKVCRTERKHLLLSAGGITCFVHGLFAVAYYVSAAATLKENRRKSQDKNPAAGLA